MSLDLIKNALAGKGGEHLGDLIFCKSSLYPVVT